MSERRGQQQAKPEISPFTHVFPRGRRLSSARGGSGTTPAPAARPLLRAIVSAAARPVVRSSAVETRWTYYPLATRDNERQVSLFINRRRPGLVRTGV